MKEEEKENLYITFQQTIESIIKDKRKYPKHEKLLNNFKANINLGLQIEEDYYFWVNLIAKEGNFSLNKGKLDEYDLEVERVSRMIKENNYFDFDFNPKGSGIQHIYTYLSNDTIEDKSTGLIWQRGGSENMLNFDKTMDYIKELNQNNFAGFNNWRLPTLKEAMALMESQRTNTDFT